MKFFRKAVIGFSAIGATLLTLGTVTYAWFPINSIARVEASELSVHGGQGFMVSVDGVNYKNDLTRDDIYNAMIARMKPTTYKLYGDSTHSGLYGITTIESTDEYGNPVVEYVADIDNPANNQDIKNALKNLELIPLTTKNGVSLTDLYNSSASATTGRFIEFSVYFKTTSNSGEYEKASTYESDRHYYELVIEDGIQKFVEVSSSEVNSSNFKNYYIFRGFKYDIYLNGETQYSDPKAGEVTEISPTKFMSVPTTVYLSAQMTAVIDGNIVNKVKGDSIIVYSSNAIRMSITDENAYNSNPGEYVANIYELNDSVNGNKNLGSYATTYDETFVNSYVESFKASKLAEDPNFNYNAYLDSLNALYGDKTEKYCKNMGLIYDDDLYHEYNYQNNAMYTYYTKLSGRSTLTTKVKDYDYFYFPTTIKDLTSKDVNGDYIYNKKITTLSSDEDGKLITFRIWLEGWDADCFDGLKDSITASLSFSSKRIY